MLPVTPLRSSVTTMCPVIVFGPVDTSTVVELMLKLTSWGGVVSCWPAARAGKSAKNQKGRIWSLRPIVLNRHLFRCTIPARLGIVPNFESFDCSGCGAKVFVQPEIELAAIGSTPTYEATVKAKCESCGKTFTADEILRSLR